MSDSGPDAPRPVTEVDFDHFRPSIIENPFPMWEQIRDARVAHTDAHDGYYIVGDYESVFNAATDVETFCSRFGIGIPKRPMPPLLPSEVDPPLHRSYRSVINPYLSPPAVAQFDEVARRLCKDAFSALRTDEDVDIVERFCEPFPRTIALRLLSFPAEDEQQLAEWTSTILTVSDPEVVGPVATAFGGYLNELLARRRAEPPTDDLTSAVVHGQIDGRKITEDEALNLMMTLVFGGLHTTTSALASMLHWLGTNPDEFERLHSEPKLRASAVEEILRLHAPTPYIARTTTDDVDLGGCPIPSGSKILISLGAANRDPAQFDQPDSMVVDRQPNRHLSFAAGPHRCAGSHLARLEMRVALDEVLAAYSRIEVTEGDLQWVGGETRRIERLRVRVSKR